MASRSPSPGPRVASQLAGPALDLDEEDAFRGHYERVDLGDRAVQYELKVRPRPIGLMVRKIALEEREGIAFPRELRRGDLGPVAIHRSDILPHTALPVPRGLNSERRRVNNAIVAIEQ